MMKSWTRYELIIAVSAFIYAILHLVPLFVDKAKVAFYVLVVGCSIFHTLIFVSGLAGLTARKFKDAYSVWVFVGFQILLFSTDSLTFIYHVHTDVGARLIEILFVITAIVGTLILFASLLSADLFGENPPRSGALKLWMILGVILWDVGGFAILYVSWRPEIGNILIVMGFFGVSIPFVLGRYSPLSEPIKTEKHIHTEYGSIA